MKRRSIYVAGQRVRLSPSALIGTGGEADVYALSDSRALKLFKGPDHPDVAGDQARECAARMRLQVHQDKLRAFPTGLPERVVQPSSLATTRKRGGSIVGYAMPLIAGAEMLYRYAEPRFRRRHVNGDQVVDALLDLHTSVAGLHTAGVVIGDFNDLNVLVRDGRAYIIDADSFQFAGYPCPVFTERFVDPLLCQKGAQAPVLARTYTTHSDWYAFAVMVMRSLLCVGPYGGVYRPRDRTRRMAHGARPLARVTVFDPEVVYPRPAIPFDRLPDDLLAHLHATFVEDARVPFPVHLLEELRWRRCRSCGQEHARVRCPACHPVSGMHAPDAQASPASGPVHRRGTVTARVIASVADGAIVDAALQDGSVRWLIWDGAALRNRHGRCWRGGALGTGPAAHRRYLCRGDDAAVVDRGQVTWLRADLDDSSNARADDTALLDVRAGDASGRMSVACHGERSVWLQGGQLFATGSLGPRVLGQVLRRQTRIWLGARFGLGLYRAGALTVAFTFDPACAGIDDRAAVPRIRGAVLDMHCELGDDRAWLWWREKRASREMYRCACIGRDGRLLGSASVGSHELGDSDRHSRDASTRDAATGSRTWLRSAVGACAAGPYLLVPTDAGIARVAVVGDRLQMTTAFPDTAPFVDASTRLLAGRDGLYAVSEQQITLLALT